MALQAGTLQGQFAATESVTRQSITQLETGGCIYAHQREAILAVQDRFELQQEDLPLGAPFGVAAISIPTGGGRSGIYVLMAYLRRARNVLVIASSLEFTNQLHMDFCSGGVHALVIRRGIFRQEDIPLVLPPLNGTKAIRTSDLSAITDVNNVFPHNQTLLVVYAQKFTGGAGVNLENIQRNFFDLIIVDEAQHYPVETWNRIIDHFGPNPDNNNQARILFGTTTTDAAPPYVPPLEVEIALTPSIVAPSIVYTLTMNEAIQRGIIPQL